MGEALQLHDGIGRKDLQAIQRRFLGINRERRERIIGELRPGQQDFINLLPLLFHINHPMLPGYVNNETPAGIADFSPTQGQLRLARSISRSFFYGKRALRKFHIEGLYLMGSIGTIGHNRASDFDVWLCHDPNLSRADRDLLQQKAEGIEKWAQDLALEVHIFLMDVASFRRGDRAALSQESSGSTQQGLLLEEFYRSSVFLAGRMPLWWLVPPEEEARFRSYADMLVTKRFIDPREYLDFGGLDQIRPDEFFGAALWHLYKGVGSPYKAVLKILLMEAYANEYPHPHWLAQQAKAAIYAGETDLDQLDAYCLMYRHVERHLQRSELPERLELARRCFYFKVGEQLSRTRLNHTWRSEVMLRLTTEWGWGQATFITLDARPSWKIDQVTKERGILVRELSRSYRLLTEFARNHADETQIDPLELHLLGRKLYTALELRPGKVERINPGVSNDLNEPFLSLHFTDARNGGKGWFLYLGQVEDPTQDQAKPLKSTVGLIEILAWCQINQLTGYATVFNLYPEDGPVKDAELRSLLDSLRHLFPKKEFADPALTDLSRPSCVISCALFPNIGTDPMAHLSKEGKQLTSNRSDALSFGALHTNLVHNLELLTMTSWGELLVSRYQDLSGLMDGLCHFLNAGLRVHPQRQSPMTTAHNFSSARGPHIARRTAELFNACGKAFAGSTVETSGRYLLQAEDGYMLVEEREQGFVWIQLASLDELLDELGTPQSRFRPLHIDSWTLVDTPYPLLFQHNQPNVLQLFYLVQNGTTNLFILDEQGSLFRQTLSGTELRHLLIHQQRFLDSMQRLRLLLSPTVSRTGLLPKPEFYHLQHDRFNGWRVESQRPPSQPAREEYADLRLITAGTASLDQAFALVCDGQAFASLEYGEGIYLAVAEHIQKLRRSRETYPIYLTSVHLHQATVGGVPASVEILRLKRHLEFQLNQALATRLKN